MLIGHTSQVSFIISSLSTHKLEQFVSISDNDGYVITTTKKKEYSFKFLY